MALLSMDFISRVLTSSVDDANDPFGHVSCRALHNDLQNGGIIRIIKYKNIVKSKKKGRYCLVIIVWRAGPS